MMLRKSKSESTPHSRSGVSPRAEVGGAPSLRAQHVEEWRDAARRVARAYYAWCAADRRTRRGYHLSFLDALSWEERAARQVELDAAAVASPPR